MAKRVLIIEDSKSVANTLSMLIEEFLEYETVKGASMKECAKLFLEYKGKFDVALLDLGLPDAQNGEVVDFVSKFNVPMVILTGSVTVEDKIKNKSKNIVDYVVKDGMYSYKYTLSIIKRIINNQNIDVLIVDDSKSFIEKTKALIEKYRLTVYSASNGKEALEILQNNINIKVVLTDYYMPTMNGLDFVRAARKKYSKDELSIIVTSVTQEKSIASKFLKCGANDFLYKGFTPEELYVRINANIEVLELFEELKNRANRDFLTNLYNRRYLFEEGIKKLNIAKEENTNLNVALIDIDKFKAINDTYGHDVGDSAIKMVADFLQEYFNKDEIVARLGGEEFCIIFIDEDENSVKGRLEHLRREFESRIIKVDNHNINFTISIGCCFKKFDTLDIMLQEADNGLYDAKDSGRNRIRYR